MEFSSIYFDIENSNNLVTTFLFADNYRESA